MGAEALMLTETADELIWRCDDCGQQAAFPANDFYAAVNVLKRQGWEFTKSQELGWLHMCRDCKKSAADVLNMPARRALQP